MRRAGFVLVGGRSARMQRDKALLPYGGATLAGHVAAIVGEAAGSVALIGSPERYGFLGFEVYPDRFPDCGPAGGIHAALAARRADWNLIAGCDMPGVSAEGLRFLLAHATQAEAAGALCIIPAGADGELQPLCAVYHANCLPAFERAIHEKRFKMRDLARDLSPWVVAGAGPALFGNVNTPDEWRAWQSGETPP